MVPHDCPTCACTYRRKEDDMKTLCRRRFHCLFKHLGRDTARLAFRAQNVPTAVILKSRSRPQGRMSGPLQVTIA
jgi:hypothetical protein